MNSICPTCGLPDCSCASGITRVVAGGGSLEEAQRKALSFLAKRGYAGQVLDHRRRRTRLGVMGYVAYEFRVRVAP